ncbi:Uncharacterized protein dnm_005430 [Desulfonema magnum]|uniref:Uncharacterized protein n=1 Tax=Desulfonema magnum TaxID=45655 RepID=A0A975BFR8_9BACT|nr:Uncharacterized protein dnm_005430 [Desulfonema magnum]
MFLISHGKSEKREVRKEDFNFLFTRCSTFFLSFLRKPVIPAKAGIPFCQRLPTKRQWIPAFAGMTEKNLIIE